MEDFGRMKCLHPRGHGQVAAGYDDHGTSMAGKKAQYSNAFWAAQIFALTGRYAHWRKSGRRRKSVSWADGAGGALSAMEPNPPEQQQDWTRKTKAGRVAKDAILFQIEIADAGNPCLGGAPVEFLSVFPDEREELFPPLTLLRPLPPDDGDGEGDEVAYVGGGLLGQRAPICTVHVGDVCLRVVKMYPTAGGSRG